MSPGGSVSVRIIRWGLWLLVLAGTYGVHQQIPSTPAASREEVFLPRPELARLASLGFNAVMSDYYWIQAIYKVGGTRDRLTSSHPIFPKSSTW